MSLHFPQASDIEYQLAKLPLLGAGKNLVFTLNPRHCHRAELSRAFSPMAYLTGSFI
jgi:hypothetical protein